jgi:polyvinyl alcohol dehydrogenase (cytochrome)
MGSVSQRRLVGASGLNLPRTGKKENNKVRWVLITFVFAWTVQIAVAQEPDGRALFTAKCAGCHTANPDATNRAPTPEALRARSPEAIIDALTGGAMRYQGLSLSGVERRAIAESITGRKVRTDLAVSASAKCVSPSPAGNLSSASVWNGWGPNIENTHFQSAARAGITAEQIPKLKLKWAFAFPDATSAWAQPTVVGNRLYVGSQNGTVYALDAKSGCVVWTFNAEGGVRGSVTVGPRAAYIADQKGYAYAVDASSGKLLWKHLVDKHPLIRLTGSPILHNGRLYVPTSSYEEVGKGPDYACCTFRGSIVALDAANGKEIWRTYTITEEPKVLGKNNAGIDSLGPSGGAIWSAPTIDVKRNAIYAATGNTYSGPTSQPGTDAIVAFDLKTGRPLWTKQLHPDDIFGCRNNEPNCGSTQGPDFDFGASPALVKLPNGKDALIVGQKSGMGYALDPDKRGEVLWQYRAGRGSTLGGIEWGVAADSENAYFPVADASFQPAGGLHAVRLATGERVWFTPAPTPLNCGAQSRTCNGAQSAAITVVPGVVFSGSFDGGIRAYSTKDGAVFWNYDTNREFTTVNGVPGHGGSINGPAAVVVGGMIYVSSGDYRSTVGNILLAFGVD